MGSDLTSFEAMLQNDYDPALYNQLHAENNIQSLMAEDTNTEGWSGSKKVIATKLGRNWSVGSIGAAGAIPAEGKSTYKNFEVPIKDIYGRVGFERYVMEQSKKSSTAWADVVSAEMDGLVEDLSFHRNRIGWGYGSGILALVNGAVSSSTTVTVDAPLNVSGAVNGNRHLFGDATSGMFVAFLNSSTNAIEAYGTIVGYSAGGTQITMSSAISCNDNCKIVIAQNATQHSLNKEPEGLLAGIDDGTYVGTYHNLSRTTYPVLKSYVMTGVGALSLDAIQQAIDATSIRVGRTIDLFLCEHGVRRAYLTLLEADRRYTGADLKSPDGGTSAAKKPTGKTITYGDIPIMADRDGPYGMLFGMNKASWTRYSLRKPGWVQDDGSILKWVSGYDAFTAYYMLMENYHCQYPARNFRMEGISVNTLSVHAF